MDNRLIELFPRDYRRYWERVCGAKEQLQEIRIRAEKPVAVLLRGEEWFVTPQGEWTGDVGRARCASAEEVRALLQHICEYSPYAYEEELRRGYLTLSGGHRVGIVGQVVMEGTAVRTIKNVAALNLRIAHQIKGVADGVMPYIYHQGMLRNTLIISPPGCGKTTLLRDIIRQVSNGNVYAEGMTVGVVDERSELAGCYMGVPQNDIGVRTDVLDGCPKELGMLMLLRSMAPKVIAIDELGSGAEFKALQVASACGCSVIATAHGMDRADAEGRFSFAEGGLGGLFGLLIVLGRRNGRCVVEKMEKIR